MLIAMVVGAWNVPSPLPSRTVTELSDLLAVTRSANPSPLRSAASMNAGCRPILNVAAGWKVPSPLPSRTLTT